jgi:hypothetical protein
MEYRAVRGTATRLDSIKEMIPPLKHNSNRFFGYKRLIEIITGHFLSKLWRGLGLFILWKKALYIYHEIVKKKSFIIWHFATFLNFQETVSCQCLISDLCKICFKLQYLNTIIMRKNHLTWFKLLMCYCNWCKSRFTVR